MLVLIAAQAAASQPWQNEAAGCRVTLGTRNFAGVSAEAAASGAVRLYVKTPDDYRMGR